MKYLIVLFALVAVSVATYHVYDTKEESDIDDQPFVDMVNAVMEAEVDDDDEEERSIKCKICKFVVKEAIKLANGHTQQQVEAILDRQCHKLGFLSHKCKKFVHKELTKLWQYIQNHADPGAACHKVHLC